MKIAVLMSTYNGSKYLDEQLDSIARQTVIGDVTVYIRDDGSTDATIEIIKKWEQKMRIVLYIEKNAGPAKSFWYLIKKKAIIADYYFFCDQDDIWDDNKIETQIRELYKNVCLSVCNCRLINGQGYIVEKERLSKAPIINIPTLFVGGVSQGCSMAFTKDLKDFILEKNPQCIPMHDIVVFLYALSYGCIKWIQTPLFSYRVHEANVVAKNNKGFIKRVKTTYWNWKNSSKHSMATVAWELLKKGKCFSDEDISYLIAMSNYQNSIKNKLKILNIRNKTDKSKKAIRSYTIRVIFNLL
jgi:glycosyltransferase involved in cell wall biosynthesis